MQYEYVFNVHLLKMQSNFPIFFKRRKRFEPKMNSIACLKNYDFNVMFTSCTKGK